MRVLGSGHFLNIWLGVSMSVDDKTVHRIARLARIAVPEEEIASLGTELNTILEFIEQLSEVNTDDILPMTAVVETEIKRRKDAVTDGGYVQDVIANAPASDDDFFSVPKVVE